ncbi:MAG: hypothetical protein Q9179_002178 [Wetmoreana sp. 5 TL-2023]
MSASSHSSSITSWLAAHPERFESSETKTPKQTSKKRTKQGEISGYSKRRKLQELEPNSVAAILPQDTRQQQKSHSKPKMPPKRELPTTPGRTTRRGPRRVPLDTSQPSENDVTPRPPREAPPLSTNPRPNAPKLEHTPLHHPEDSANTSETSSKKSRRSESPREARFNLMLAETGVFPVSIDAGDIDFPAAAQALRRDLAHLESQRGLVPLSVRHLARDRLAFDHDDPYTGQESGPPGKGGLGGFEMWQRICEIQGAAQECYDEDCPESTWNMEVHSTLLRTALRGVWRSKEIWYRDITSARISDGDLLPKVAGLTRSKMVDFAIIIKPAFLSPFWDQIRHKCNELPYRTINQTDATNVRRVPIAISLEVKRAGGNEHETLVQLETWVTAHYNNLKVLTGTVTREPSDVKMPILPLIQIQGHEWKLMIAQLMSDRDMIIVHRDIPLGSTRNILGIYQIILALQRLAKWVAEEYRPWWITNVLGESG